MTGVAVPTDGADGAGAAGGSGWRAGRGVIDGGATADKPKRSASVRGISTLAWGNHAGVMEHRDGSNRAQTVSGDPGGGRLVSRPRAFRPRRFGAAGCRVRS